MQKIVPHIWFDREAIEAAEFYTSVFRDSMIKKTTTIHGTPSGSSDIVSLTILGYDFVFINAGPVFKVNPSISFLVSCESFKMVDDIWRELSNGGKALMELGSYPFSERYGWISDKYGVSWQVMYSPEQRQRVIPTLMFVGEVCGKAEEAVNYYTSIFSDSTINGVLRYGAGMLPDKEGTIQHMEYILAGQLFAAMDSAHKHDFGFNEAVSLIVNCEDQAEIDYFWIRLSAVPEAEQCGWVKDRWGVSWQITPSNMDMMLGGSDSERQRRVTEAFLKMKKIDIQALNKAYNMQP